MTPLQIEILLHCYYSQCLWPRHSPASDEGHSILTNAGLIQFDGGRGYYTATSKGHAHVSQLCRLPLPVSAWVTEDGAEIPMLVP